MVSAMNRVTSGSNPIPQRASICASCSGSSLTAFPRRVGSISSGRGRGSLSVNLTGRPSGSTSGQSMWYNILKALEGGSIAMETANIDWYRSPVGREALKEFTQKSDLKGWLQAGSFFLIFVLTTAGAFYFFRTRH